MPLGTNGHFSYSAMKDEPRHPGKHHTFSEKEGSYAVNPFGFDTSVTDLMGYFFHRAFLYIIEINTVQKPFNVCFGNPFAAKRQGYTIIHDGLFPTMHRAITEKALNGMQPLFF